MSKLFKTMAGPLNDRPTTIFYCSRCQKNSNVSRFFPRLLKIKRTNRLGRGVTGFRTTNFKRRQQRNAREREADALRASALRGLTDQLIHTKTILRYETLERVVALENRVDPGEFRWRAPDLPVAVSNDLARG